MVGIGCTFKPAVTGKALTIFNLTVIPEVTTINTGARFQFALLEQETLQ